MFLMFALIGVVLAFIPILLIILKGKDWGKRLGKPLGVNVFEKMIKATGDKQ